MEHGEKDKMVQKDKQPQIARCILIDKFVNLNYNIKMLQEKKNHATTSSHLNE